MAITQTDIDRLDAAITSAELEVEFSDGRRVKYKSTSELMAARAHAVDVLASQAPSGRGSGGIFRFRFTTTRGGL